MSKRKKFYSFLVITIIIFLAFYSYPVISALLDKPVTPPEYLMSPVKAKPRSKIVVARNKFGLPLLQKELQLLDHKDPSVAKLQELSKHQDCFIRQRVAGHPKTPTAVIKIMLQDKDGFVLQQILRRSDIDSSILMGLAQSKDWFVRQVVAGHPKTPAGALVKLSKDPQMEVRWALAKNANISLEIFKKLLQDTEEVKRQLVLNVNIPKDILQKLGSEEDEYTKKIALEKINKTH